MTLRDFEIAGRADLYFRLYGVKWLRVDENGKAVSWDYELIYDETAEKAQEITPFLDIAFKDVNGHYSEKECAILEVFEDTAPYKEFAKLCKEGIWERYKGAFWDE